MAAADPPRISNTIIGASANAARIFARRRVAFEVLEGEVATEIGLSTGHSIANTCTAPACSCTHGWKPRLSRRTTEILRTQRPGKFRKGRLLKKAR